MLGSLLRLAIRITFFEERILMKFIVSLLIFVITICNCDLLAAAPGNPPELTASISNGPLGMVLSGIIVDESPMSASLIVAGGIVQAGTISISANGEFSVALEVPPFVDTIEVKVTDAEGLSDFVTISL